MWPFYHISDWLIRRGLSFGIYVKDVKDGKIFWGGDQRAKQALQECCHGKYKKKRFGYFIPIDDWWEVREHLSHEYGLSIIQTALRGPLTGITFIDT